MKTKKEKPETRDVYAVYDPERKACKIGVWNNAPERIRNLQTGSPVDYQVAHIEKVPYPQGTKVENRARKILVDAGHPKTREWIGRCPPEAAREAIKTAAEIERGKNSSPSKPADSKRPKKGS